MRSPLGVVYFSRDLTFGVVDLLDDAFARFDIGPPGIGKHHMPR